MRSENDPTDAVNSESDPYDAAVLQFLNQEIKASSRKAADSKAHVEDVDELVDSLLKETVHATDTPASEQNNDSEEIDLLFSRIFKETKVATHAEPDRVQLLVDAKVDQKLEEIRVAKPVPADPCKVGTFPGPELTVAASVDAAAPAPAAEGVPLTPSVPPPPVPQTSKAGASPVSDAVSPAHVRPEKVPIFHLPPSKPAWNWRMAAIASAFLCLLAGMGIVLTSGSRNRAADRSNQPSVSATVSATPAAASDRFTPEVPPPVPSPVIETRDTAARTARSANPTRPADAPRVENAASAAAAPKGAKPETGVQSSPVPAPKQALTVTVTSDPVENSAAAVTPPAENPVAAPPLRVTESAPPPVVSEPAVNTVNPKPTSSLEDLAATRRPAFQPPIPAPAAPKKATPAVVISRVLPVYPEMARKSHVVGTVVVDVLIDAQGRVTKATPVSGPTSLQASAMSAVLQWQFRPAHLDGVPVPSSSQVSIIYK